MNQLKIGAFGKADSYSYLAAKAAYSNASAELVSIPYTKDVFNELRRGYLDAAVVPLENTSGGWVEDVVYELINLSTTDPTARVVKEIDLPVMLCVAGKTGHESVQTVKKIYSHPYPLVHSADWLTSQNAKGERIQTGSTSEAAEKAAKDSDSIAICNIAAARNNGLKVIVSHIPSPYQNTTRFLTVSKTMLEKSKTKSCLWFSAPNVPGGLLTGLEVFKKHKINLTNILSRSVDGFKTHRFFVEIDGDITSKPSVLKELEKKSGTGKMAIIGSYPVKTVSMKLLDQVSN